MNDVFILGAGFSKEISMEMPLLNELSGLVRKSRTDLPLPQSSLGDNLELWLSYLSQPHAWLRESNNLRNQATALEISGAIGDVLEEREYQAVQDDCPDWFRNLTAYWHEQQSSIISLNYDTLVERAAGLIQTGENSHLSPGQLYPVEFTMALRRNAMVFGDNQVETFQLFKLHGSVNWFYSGAAEPVGEVIYYTIVALWGADSSTEKRWRESVSDKVPLIVPPTTEKVRFFQHESLKRIWLRAVMSISEADRIFVCGYSLPMTDLAVRLFLLEGGAEASSKKPLYIANPDSQTIDRYQELLGHVFEVRDDYIGENAIKKLTEEICSTSTNGS